MAEPTPQQVQQRYEVQQTPDGKYAVKDLQTGKMLSPGDYREATAEERAAGVGGLVLNTPEVAAAERNLGPVEILHDSPDEQIYRYGPLGAIWREDKKTGKVQDFTAQFGLPETVKRLAIGANSPFQDITGEGGGYFPAAPEQLASFGYMLADAIPGTNFGDDNYFTRATERVAAADARTRGFLGVTPPENVGDVALEVLGGLAIPGPKFGLFGKAAAGSKVPQIARDIGNVAAETFLPLRQGSLARAAVTQVPLGVGITETIDAEGSKTDPGYKGFVDWIDEATTEKATIHDVPEELTNAFLSIDANDPRRDQAAQIILDGLENGEFDKEPAWRNGLATASAFAGLGLGAYGIRQAVRNGASQRLRGVAQQTLAGTEYNPTTTTVGTQAIGSFVQADQPVREAIRASTDAADPTIRRLDRVTEPSLNSITTHGIATGEFPNSAIKAKPIAVTLNAIAKDLSDAEWTVLTDGLLARNALDDMANSKSGAQASFNDLSPAILEVHANRLDRDPKLAKYGDAIKQHYRDNLDFMLEQGLINEEMHTAFVTARPNYVHMSRNLITDTAADTLFGGTRFSESARAHLNDIMGRNTDEASGVQTGRAADPVRELATQTSSIMRRAEINNVKRELFDIFENNAALSDVVKRIPDGEQPKNLEGIHDVVIDGHKRYYKITDPALDRAMRFNPHLGFSTTRMILGLPKRLSEFWLTGAGNPFFGPTAMAYDTFTGMTLRPRGFDLGIGNEALNSLMPTSGGLMDTIKAADPTALLSAPVGAVRLLYGDFIGGASRSLAEQMMRQDGLLYNILGPQNTGILQQRLAAAYDGSTRSLMDQFGASSTGLMHTTDVNSQGHAMADLAPEFYSRASIRAANEAMQGNGAFFNGLVQGSKAVGSVVRANAITRLYMNVMSAMHGGFRAQAFATNLPKARGDVESMQKLASQTRRISGDMAQRGSGELAGGITSTALYANPAIQGLSQVARQIKDQPITTAANVVTTMAMLTALQYAAAASDPAIAEEIRGMTDAEQARKIKTFGGIDVPISPELRIMWGPYAALMNEISGVNSGQFNPDLGQVLDRWIDGDIDVSEEGEFSIAESLKTGISDMMPLQAGSLPVVNALMASQGIDMGMTRYAGSPQEIKTQTRSGFGTEGALTGDAISAQMSAIVEDLIGTTVANGLRMAMDVDRALDVGAPAEDAVGVGLSRLKDNTVRTSGMTRGLLFGNYERVQSANSTETRLWFEKKDGIDKATSVLRQDILQAYTTGADPRAALLRNTDTVPPDLSGTALVPIGLISADLIKALRPLQTRANELRDQVAETQNQRMSSIETRNTQVNEFNKEREALMAQMLLITKQAEEAIRGAIGDSTFTYQNFDPEAYRSMQMPAPTQPSSE